MDPKLLLCSPFPSSMSLFYNNNNNPISISISSTRTHLSFFSTDKTPFLGQLKKTQTRFLFRSIAASGTVKRRKELPFDNVIQRDKKLKLVLKIRNILVSQPERVMNLRDLGRYRRDLGLTRKRRFIALLRRFPGVFEIVEEGAYAVRFRLTPEAERVYLEELRVRNDMEEGLIVKLRKLLMMSLNKRILLMKIAHLKTDLGLPTEFRSTICERYPQCFRVVNTEEGPALELTHWDPALAVSAAQAAEEEKRIREAEERNLIIDRPPRFKRVALPKGLNLSKGEMRRINMFNEMPYISPYSDFSELKPGTAEKEKHACAVVHEMLSLTLEKRTLVDHLTHFREEFRFSQQLRGMLIRHPDMFYVSLKGDRDSVFLREAYRDSQLLEKDRLLLLKEKMRALVAVPRFSRRFPAKTEESSDAEDWSDVESFLTDDDDDDDDAGDDDWSDDDDEEEEDVPPDFEDAGESLNLKEESNYQAPSGNNDGKAVAVAAPVFPDGRPRERW